ncbi:hypothetical protein IJH29_01210 [Candidatus Saccharibacteria bacterium]|nr:hypothetical protein [Candidatus Saccharibacteria bacterium]
MKILISNPETDAFTRYLLFWSNNLIKNIGSRHEIIQLKKTRANRENFEGILHKKSVDIVLLNGHGGDNLILGHDEKPMVDSKNASCLAGKIVHAMSCSSAKTLGPISIKLGAKAYVGYKEPYLAPRMDDKIADPLKDKTVSLFLNPAFIAQKALTDGKTPREAIKLAKNAYNRSIVSALTSPVQSDDDQFVGLLCWDRDNLVAVEQ